MNQEVPKRIVLRYRISPHREAQHLLLPVGAVVVHVGIKPHEEWVSIWALCPVGPVDEEPRRFWCVGTGPGWELPGTPLNHIGTAIETESSTVWHVFEEPSA